MILQRFNQIERQLLIPRPHWGHAKKYREREDRSDTTDLDLSKNTMKYINTHKRRDATELRLHFMNNK
jgi:hypothetical protein